MSSLNCTQYTSHTAAFFHPKITLKYLRYDEVQDMLHSLDSTGCKRKQWQCTITSETTLSQHETAEKQHWHCWRPTSPPPPPPPPSSPAQLTAAKHYCHSTDTAGLPAVCRTTCLRWLNGRAWPRVQQATFMWLVHSTWLHQHHTITTCANLSCSCSLSYPTFHNYRPLLFSLNYTGYLLPLEQHLS